MIKFNVRWISKHTRTSPASPSKKKKKFWCKSSKGVRIPLIIVGETFGWRISFFHCYSNDKYPSFYGQRYIHPSKFRLSNVPYILKEYSKLYDTIKSPSTSNLEIRGEKKFVFLTITYQFWATYCKSSVLRILSSRGWLSGGINKSSILMILA